MLTITEALANLKLTEKKIKQSVDQLKIGIITNKNTGYAPPGFKNLEEYKGSLKAGLQSATDLIAYRNKLKAAIVQSNATTKVAVGDVTMSVAEAIERKNSVALQRSLLEKLNVGITHSENEIAKVNKQVEQKAEEYVRALNSANSAMTEDERKLAHTNYITQNRVYLVTPDETYSVKEKLETELDEFLNKVDVALSVINAKTEISV